MIHFKFKWWDPFGIKRRHMYRFRSYTIDVVRDRIHNLLTNGDLKIPENAFEFYDLNEPSQRDLMEKFCRCEINRFLFAELDAHLITEHQMEIFTHNLRVELDRIISKNPYYDPDWVGRHYFCGIKLTDFLDDSRYVICIFCNVTEEDE